MNPEQQQELDQPIARIAQILHQDAQAQGLPMSSLAEIAATVRDQMQAHRSPQIGIFFIDQAVPPQVGAYERSMKSILGQLKLLNPKWYEGMLSHGYEGVRELSKRLVNTMGWSATANAVDNWVYEDTNTTFFKDDEMCKRLMNLNPNSFRKMVTTLLEANGRGYWETNEENLARLRQLYQEVEDRIEGIE